MRAEILAVIPSELWAKETAENRLAEEAKGKERLKELRPWWEKGPLE
jgi:hypothetical protein